MARPRVKGDCLDDLTALMAERERMLCCRLSASRREAIASARWVRGTMGDGAVMGGFGVEIRRAAAWPRLRLIDVRNLLSRDFPGSTAGQ